MQGSYTLSEPVSERREFLFFLVLDSDGKSPATSEATGQPEIRKPGETTWSNTSALLFAIGNGHYRIILTADELDTLGQGSIRYKSGNTVEFQDVFRVAATSAEVNLDAMNASINKNREILKDIQWKINLTERKTQVDPFVSPL